MVTVVDVVWGLGINFLARKQGINGAPYNTMTGSFCVVKFLCPVELNNNHGLHLHEYSILSLKVEEVIFFLSSILTHYFIETTDH